MSEPERERVEQRKAGDRKKGQQGRKADERRKSLQVFWRTMRRVAPYVRRYWRLAAGSGGFVVVSSLFALLEPWPLALLVDSVLSNKPAPGFLRGIGGDGPISLLLIAVFAGFVITSGIYGLSVLSEYVNTKLDQRMVLDFRSDLFRHCQRLSLSFHENQRTGQLMNRINYQASSMGTATLAFPPMAQSIFTLVGMFWIAYRIDAQLALLSLTVVPFVYHAVGRYATRIVPAVRRVRRMEGESLSIVHETMAMLRVIVAFGREGHEYGRFRRQGERTVDARINVTVRQTLFSMAVGVITAAGSALVLGFGAFNVLRGRLTVGELLVVISYIAAVYAPLQAISSSLALLQEKLVVLDTSFRLLDQEPEVKDAPDAVPIDGTRGAVRFENVSFQYKGRNKALDDISFEAEEGQTVAVVGRTGAGKSTLVSLVPRFYDPKKGRILLDGHDIRKITLESLRRQISMVLQEPLLFSGTIGDNIRYGRLDATDEEVVEAARAANAHDFIEAFPKGYETKIGERGAKLSGGERQRISIARAFLRDAPILILDEPTSAIDSKTEEVILDALDRLMAGRTTFIIAHRLSTVRDADNYLVLEQGRLVERGTRNELLARAGPFRQMYEAQTGERLDDSRRPPPAETGDRRLAALARSLRSSKEADRAWAFRSLKEADEKEIRGWLRSTLRTGGVEEASYAAQAAHILGIRQMAGPILHGAVRVPDNKRAPFMEALRGLSFQPASLAKALARFEHPAAREAVQILKELGGRDALRSLREQLAGNSAPEELLDLLEEESTPDVSPLAQEEASRKVTEELAHLSGEELHALEVALGRAVSGMGLVPIDGKPSRVDSESLSAALGADPSLADAAERILARVASSADFTAAAPPPLVERLAGVEILGAIGGPTSVAALRRTIDDPSSRVRTRVGQVLYRLGASSEVRGEGAEVVVGAEEGS
jgi:ATP-binding cassette subfamily B protein